MHVLICDDDASTRFVIRRALAGRFGCEVTECSNGTQALDLIARKNIDLLVLDIEMPVLNGIEVVQTIRRSPELAHLPIVMLSKERREEVVLDLMKMGISGYIAKPPRTERVNAVFGQVLPAIMRRAARSVPSGIALDDDHPALIVEGDLEYRQFFVTLMHRYGPVLEADSGASALTIFRQSPVQLVFVGAGLGVVGPDLLVRKLRALAGDRPLRVIRLVEQGVTKYSTGPAFDDVMPRSSPAAALLSECGRFVRAHGPLTDASALTGDLAAHLATAAAQVFGMMLDAEIEPTDAVPAGGAGVTCAIDIDLERKFVLSAGVHLSVPMATALTARMLSWAPEAVTEEDYVPKMAELASLVTERLRAAFDQKKLRSTCSLPRSEPRESLDVPEPPPDQGFVLRFAVPNVSGCVCLSLVVSPIAGTRSETAV